jgi:hypothetical protein
MQPNYSMPTSRRRWFRFSLRTLLIFVIVVAIPLAWIAKERRQSQHELRLAEELDKRNAVSVTLGGPFDEWGHRKKNTPQAWWRDLARRVLGARVVGVSCSARVLEDLSPLTPFRSLQSFYCGGHDLNYTMGEMNFVRDLSPLAPLTNLRWLCLSRCHLPDVSPLAELTNLTELKFNGTDVTEEQITALQVALPNCKIEQRQFR